MALSDPGGVLASPLTIVSRRDERWDIEAITSIIDQHQVGRVVVGLPFLMDGSLGRQAEKVTAFVRQLRDHIEIPVEFRDERLTTVEAKRLLHSARVRRTRKKVRDDAAAAALILQAYLDEGRSRDS